MTTQVPAWAMKGDNVLTYMISGLALLTSIGSLIVSVLTYRMAGPKVLVVEHAFSFLPDQVWLQVKVANAGKGEIDIDGATCDLLGPTVSVLPHRMKAASSHVIEFRKPISEGVRRAGSVTVNVGFGNGRSLTSQVRMTELEQAALRRLVSEALSPRRPPIGGEWRGPTQEEL